MSLLQSQTPSLIYRLPTRQQTAQLEEDFDLATCMEWTHELWLMLYRFLYYLKLKEQNPIYFDNLPISSTTPIIKDDDTTASNNNGTNDYHGHANRNSIYTKMPSGTGETSGRLACLFHRLYKCHSKETTRRTPSNVNDPPCGKYVLRDTMYKLVASSESEDEAVRVAVLKFRCDINELKNRIAVLNELNDETVVG
ncbi:unnamed protein product [Ambrosiozyma monospora]|uniref:Unnamed protein product n=1 Tax=Ambrosiozyma monospora TaxID=43982 RepID=A0A9W6YXD2_AMBMO|nr:unnamed protein product [Ambrosiozyma monospora]